MTEVIGFKVWGKEHSAALYERDSQDSNIQYVQRYLTTDHKENTTMYCPRIIISMKSKNPTTSLRTFCNASKQVIIIIYHPRVGKMLSGTKVLDGIHTDFTYTPCLVTSIGGSGINENENLKYLYLFLIDSMNVEYYKQLQHRIKIVRLYQLFKMSIKRLVSAHHSILLRTQSVTIRVNSYIVNFELEQMKKCIRNIKMILYHFETRGINVYTNDHWKHIQLRKLDSFQTHNLFDSRASKQKMWNMK
ncbi:Hypothetical_protein [Hexamita inflata]|uniref:Hypothetical_protein n=1 Tax=Hexamita inflata TaxID=28002 RepID=A0ABP1IJZ4_9EUKA